jgi:oligopeptide/dipeptide ABC transporter ATP-binding protein
MTALLEVKDLTVRAGNATILRGVTLSVPERTILGVVGESGSGKSTLGAAMMGMLPAGLRAEGDVAFQGQDMLAPAAAALRGTALAAVGQDPAGALNPLFTVGTHLRDVTRRRHPGLSRHDADARGQAMLARIGIAGPAERMAAYPHQLSGGMRQRVAIAMALLAEPALLIADEPTTALDATVEAQVAGLFTELPGSTVLISHHLGFLAQLCDAICVLYAGTVVEQGPVEAVIRTPKHPYTQALLGCEIDWGGAGPLRFIPGDVPDPRLSGAGCLFAPRCPRAEPRCRATVPPLTLKAPGQRAACLLVPDA